MRTIMALSIIMMIPAMAYAAPELSLRIERRYGVRTLEITKEQGKFRCQTESQPKFTLKRNPFKEFVLVSEANIIKKTDCHDAVTIKFRKEKISGCLTDPEISKVVEKFDSICRY